MNHDGPTTITPNPARCTDRAGIGYPLRGRALRFVLVNELLAHSSMTVADMVACLHGYGYDLGGRASKVISDALRWELRRGRVRKTSRGVYRYHQAPVSTTRRIRLLATACHHWIVTTTRTETPPPTPPNRRPGPTPWPHNPARPPWTHLGWLWTT